MSQTPTELQENHKVRFIERGLNAITRALIGDDEERRLRGIILLSNAPPAVARRLVDKLVLKLQRGGDAVRERAQAALVAAGKHAVFSVTLAALKARNTKQQILVIGTLLALGLRLGEADRGNIVTSLIGMLFEDKDRSVRGAAMSALVALRRV